MRRMLLVVGAGGLLFAEAGCTVADVVDGLVTTVGGLGLAKSILDVLIPGLQTFDALGAL